MAYPTPHDSTASPLTPAVREKSKGALQPSLRAAAVWDTQPCHSPLPGYFSSGHSSLFSSFPHPQNVSFLRTDCFTDHPVRSAQNREIEGFLFHLYLSLLICLIQNSLHPASNQPPSTELHCKNTEVLYMEKQSYQSNPTKGGFFNKDFLGQDSFVNCSRTGR